MGATRAFVPRIPRNKTPVQQFKPKPHHVPPASLLRLTRAKFNKFLNANSTMRIRRAISLTRNDRRQIRVLQVHRLRTRLTNNRSVKAHNSHAQSSVRTVVKGRTHRVQRRITTVRYLSLGLSRRRALNTNPFSLSRALKLLTLRISRVLTVNTVRKRALITNSRSSSIVAKRQRTAANRFSPRVTRTLS